MWLTIEMVHEYGLYHGLPHLLDRPQIGWLDICSSNKNGLNLAMALW